MENQQNLQKKLKVLQTVECEFKEDHTEDILTFICTDKRCRSKNQYLHPMCANCLENKVHEVQNHKESNLRKFLKDIVGLNQRDGEQSSFQKQNTEKKANIIDNLKVMKKNLSLAQDNIGLIIEQIDITLKNIDKLYEIDISEQISAIADSTNYEDFKINLEKLDQCIEISYSQQQIQQQCEIKFKNQKQNQINHIQNLVDQFQTKFSDLSQQTLQYQKQFKYENIDIQPDQSLKNVVKFEFDDYNTFTNTPFEIYKEATHLILKFKSNRIGNDGAIGIGKSIERLNSLTNLTLYLGSNEIGKDGAIGIGKSIERLNSLTNLTLDLQYNGIGKDGAIGIGKSIERLNSLTNLTLNLRYNGIGNDGAIGIGKSIERLNSLTNLTLDLQSNEIGNDGAIGIGKSIERLNSLTNLTLDLQSNRIGKDGAIGIGKSIERLNSLTNLTLDLYNNNINQEVMDTINNLEKSINNKDN